MRNALPDNRRRWWILGIEVLLVGGAAVSMLVFHRMETGYWLPGSALSRVILGSYQGLRWEWLGVNSKVAERLLAYAPLTVLWLAGSVAVLRQSGHRRMCAVIPVLISWTFFGLYSTVLGSAHLARYLVFVMPFYALTAVAGLVWLGAKDRPGSCRSRRFLRWSGVVAAVWMVSVFGLETGLRLRMGDSRAILMVGRAVSQRATFSDEMLVWLGSPAKRPVVLAYEEVQIRYQIDGRFVIRSLDGRTDPRLLDYVRDGNVDHLGYVAFRCVDYVMETPNYNRDPHRWSLGDLWNLKVDDRVSRGGVTIIREANAFRVVAPRCS